EPRATSAVGGADDAARTAVSLGRFPRCPVTLRSPAAPLRGASAPPGRAVPPPGVEAAQRPVRELWRWSADSRSCETSGPFSRGTATTTRSPTASSTARTRKAMTTRGSFIPHILHAPTPVTAQYVVQCVTLRRQRGGVGPQRCGAGRRCCGAGRSAAVRSVSAASRRVSAELGEPDPDLAGGGLLGVGAVDEVLDDGEVLLAGEVAADGAGRRLGGIGGTGQGAEAGDHVDALGDDRDQGRGAHVLHQARVEGLALVLGVVRGELLGGGGALGEGDDVVALGLDAAEDLPAQAALDGVGLEQDECALCGHSTRVPTDPGRSGTAGGGGPQSGAA